MPDSTALPGRSARSIGAGAFELSDRISTRAAELSKDAAEGGPARALLHEPTVLLLDEPTSGLDPEVTCAVRRPLDDLRTAGCAILVSTHNLDEAERLADRVAVLQGRLLAIDRPAELRRRLTTGRLLARVAGDPERWLDTARTFDPSASIEGGALVVTLGDPDHATPAFVRALVGRGAEILEIRPEVPALEDVYLHLMTDGPTDPRARS